MYLACLVICLQCCRCLFGSPVSGSCISNYSDKSAQFNSTGTGAREPTKGASSLPQELVDGSREDEASGRCFLVGSQVF